MRFWIPTEIRLRSPLGRSGLRTVLSGFRLVMRETRSALFGMP